MEKYNLKQFRATINNGQWTETRIFVDWFDNEELSANEYYAMDCYCDYYEFTSFKTPSRQN